MAALALTALVVPLIAGCTTDPTLTGSIKPDAEAKSDRVPGATQVAAVSAGEKQRGCLVRAMYFESNRSSSAGMLAVGSVVMNRVKSPKFPDTICSVVGQPRQFAPGVMTRTMTSRVLPNIEKMADAVVKGARHPKVGDAMFFHTAGLHFPYDNMHYVAVAGGNAFYQKTTRYAKNAQPPASEAIGPVVASVDSLPVPSDRPEGALPGVSTAFVTPAKTDATATAEAAFAAATN